MKRREKVGRERKTSKWKAQGERGTEFKTREGERREGKGKGEKGR